MQRTHLSSSKRGAHVPLSRLRLLWLFQLLSLPWLPYASPAFADKPLWELGAGIGYFTLPSYPGSKHRESYLLPTPVLHYNGEKLKISRGKFYTPLFKSDRVHIKLSGDGTPPVDSHETTPRLGMPDLDATLQIGPSIEFLLNNDTESSGSWLLKVPLRLSLATDLSRIDDRGWVLNPKLNYRRDLQIKPGALRFRFTMASIFADRRYLDYYYGVDTQYETNTRSRYSPGSGYAGSYLSSAVSYQREPWQVSVYARVKWLNNSSYEDSPLVETRQERQLGILFIYTFAQSTTRVSN